MDYTPILEQVRHYVRSMFDTHANGQLFYHSRYHTEQVVEKSALIARHYTLNETDFFIVQVAAWFHDCGYLTGGVAEHEERGARMAEAFLGGTGVDPVIVAAIRRCILATQLPQRATSLTEQIVCDADLFHLGTTEFGDRNKLMRKEAEEMHQKKISKEEWRRGTIRLFETHRYYTEYCRSLLDAKKQENLLKLKVKEGGVAGPAGLVSAGNPLDHLLHEHNEGDDEPVTEKEKKAKKKENPGRGIDTVFRITSNNNQRLSSQADSKAHILIQVNSIIISVLLSLLLRKIEDHANLAIPTIILLTVNLVTIILSILATRPHIPSGTFTKKDLDDKTVNLLFFGNFYKMSLEEYAGGMLVMLDEKDFLYGSLIRDVYFQGIALGKKYRWLRLSYNVFMYGLIGSVFAFVIAALLYPAK